MVREVLANSPKEFDPRKILGPAKDAMKEVAKAKCGCSAVQGKPEHATKPLFFLNYCWLARLFQKEHE
jgi:hypothetical protein